MARECYQYIFDLLNLYNIEHLAMFANKSSAHMYNEYCFSRRKMILFWEIVCAMVTHQPMVAL